MSHHQIEALHPSPIIFKENKKMSCNELYVPPFSMVACTAERTDSLKKEFVSVGWSPELLTSLAKSMWTDIVIPVDLSLSPKASVTKVVSCEGLGAKLFITHSKPNIKLIPMCAINVYLDEVISTAVGARLGYVNSDGFSANYHRVVSSLRSIPFYNFILARTPYITLRTSDDLWLISKMQRRSFEIFMRSRMTLFGIGMTIKLPVPTKWSPNKPMHWAVKATYALVTKAERSKWPFALVSLINNYGICADFEKPKAVGSIRSMTFKNNQYIKYWRSFSTIVSWTRMWMEGVPEAVELWNPESLRNLFGSEDVTPTSNEPTGFFTDIKKIFGNVRDADVIAKETSNNVAKSISSLEETIKKYGDKVFPEDDKEDILTGHLTAPIYSIFGRPIFKALNIDVQQLCLNVLAAVKMESKTAKALYILKILKDAGAKELLMGAVNYVRGMTQPDVEPTDENAASWLSKILDKPIAALKALYAGMIGLLSGFRKVKWTTITRYWKNILRTCKDLHGFSQGLMAIGKIKQVLMMIIEKAMIFCNKYCGTNFDVFDETTVHAKIQEMVLAYSVIVEPRVCAAICANPTAVEKFATLYNDLVRIKSHPRVAGKRAIQDMIRGCLADTNNSRVRINIAKAMLQQSMCPYSLMLVGESGIGKSTLIAGLIDRVASTIGLNKSVYHFDPAGRWMDGYNGSESFIVMDDIFKTREAEDIKFILNLIGPGIFLAPVAMNETRPTSVASPVIISTSNQAYVDCPELTTPDAVDRRFKKWRVVLNSDYRDAANSTVLPTALDVDIDTLYTFELMPATINSPSTSTRPMKFSEFVEYISKDIKDHISKEKTFSRTSARTFESRTEDALRAILTSPPAVTQEELESYMKLPYDVASTFALVDDPVDPPEENEEEEQGEIEATSLTMRDLIRARYGFDTKDYIDNGNPVKNWNYFTAFVDPTNAVDDGLTPCWTFKIEGTEVVVPIAAAMHLKFHKNVPAEECNWVLTKYCRTWTEADCYANLNVEMTENLAMSLQWDEPIINFTLKFNELTSAQRSLLYSRIIQRLATWRKIFEKPITIVKTTGRCLWSLLKIVGYGIGVGLLTALMYSVAIGVVFLMIKIMERLYAPPEPTSNFKTAAPKMSMRAKDFIPTSNSVSQHVTQAKQKLHSNLFSAKFTTKDTTNNFNMFGLEGQFYAIPKHVLYNKPTTDGYYTIGVSSRQSSGLNTTRYVEHTFHKTRDVYYVPNRDIAIIRLENRSMVQSIMRMLPTEVPDCDITGHVINLYWRAGVFGEMCTVVDGTTKSTTMRASYASIVTQDNIFTADCHDRGTSGGVCMSSDNRVEKRALGMLSCSNFTSGYGLVTPFVLREIREGIEALSPNVPTCSVAFEECEGDAPVLGETQMTVSTPNKTSLTKTPMYGILGVGQALPVLDIKGVDHLSDGRFKTEKVELATISPVDLNTIADELGLYYKVKLHQHYGYLPRVKSIEKALVGDYFGGKHIELTTSPGIGKGLWMFNRTRSGKTDFIKIGSDGRLEYVAPELVDIVNTQIATHLSGHVTATAFAQFPKDELRPPAKPARSIDGSPLEDQVEYRMLFGELDGMLNHLPKLVSRSGPGLDLQSDQGDELAKFLRSEFVRPFVYDVKKWDANITLQLWNADARLVNVVYGDDFGVAREMLLRQSCLAPIVSGKYVIQPGKGMRSGYPGTANSNTRIHLMLLIHCIKNIMKQHTNKETSLAEVFNAVYFIAYADDIIGAVKDPLWFDIINGATIADEMEKIGFTVVDPSGKTDKVKEVASVDELNFLKHSPVWSEDLQRFIWKIEFASIQNCVNYTSGNDFSESLDSIFYHLYPYGEKIYEEARSAINNRLYKYKVVYPVSFNAMTSRWLKGDHPGEYEDMVFYPDDLCFDE